MDPDKIMEIAREIKCAPLNAEKKRDHFRELHKEFVEKYPTLFNLCCEGTTELRHLESMCKLLTTHNTEAATVKVGQMLFDDFVKPVLPPEQKKRKHSDL